MYKSKRFTLYILLLDRSTKQAALLLLKTIWMLKRLFWHLELTNIYIQITKNWSS